MRRVFAILQIHLEWRFRLPDALVRFQKAQSITERIGHCIGAASCAAAMEIQFVRQAAAQTEELVGCYRCHQAPSRFLPHRERTRSFSLNFVKIASQIAQDLILTTFLPELSVVLRSRQLHVTVVITDFVRGTVHNRKVLSFKGILTRRGPCYFWVAARGWLWIPPYNF